MSHLELSATRDTITATVTISTPDDVAWCEAGDPGLAVVELAADQPVTLRIVGPPAVLRAVLLDAVCQLGDIADGWLYSEAPVPPDLPPPTVPTRDTGRATTAGLVALTVAILLALVWVLAHTVSPPPATGPVALAGPVSHEGGVDA